MAAGLGPLVSLLAAASENGVIGRDNGMPWHLPDDLRHFKALTLGKPVLMGPPPSPASAPPRRRSTTRGRPPAGGALFPGATAVPDLDAALRAAGPVPELVVAGGAQVYALALPRASRIYLTRIHAVIEGDTRLPDIDPACWFETARAYHPVDARHAYAMSFITLERRTT